MEYRTLGKTGIRISELFLGAMTFGEQGGVGAPLAECRSMLDAYLDAAGNVIDTAINYRGGLSEEIVGEILDHRRARFVVASKYTVTRDPTDPNGGGNHRKNLRLSLETSLRRLRTDYLDLYWVHVWDDATPIEETMRALDDIVRTGKVLAIGISDTPAWVIARGHPRRRYVTTRSSPPSKSPTTSCSETPTETSSRWRKPSGSPSLRGLHSPAVSSPASSPAALRPPEPASTRQASPNSSGRWQRWSTKSPTSSVSPRRRSPWRGP